MDTNQMISTRVCAVALALATGACASTPPPAPAQPRAVERADQAPATGLVPAFPLAALKGPHGLRAKLRLRADGSLDKASVYVRREGIPDWVHQKADELIGSGEDLAYEVEQYSNGDTTYEVTRSVGGNKVELSVRSTDQTVLYIEHKDMPIDGLPEPVRTTAATITGFSAHHCDIKEQSGSKTYVVEGEREGRPFAVSIAEDGSVRGQRSSMPAELQILD